jgi:hypothetical protein
MKIAQRTYCRQNDPCHNRRDLIVVRVLPPPFGVTHVTPPLYLVTHRQKEAAGSDDASHKNGVEVLPPEKEKGDTDKNKREYPQGAFHNCKV